MDAIKSGPQTLNLIVGQNIKAAYSSLNAFSCEFTNGQALLLSAIESTTGPAIQVTVIDAGQLDKEVDAVCKVDWSWITGSKVAATQANNNAVRLTLDPAGPLVIAVNVWQGKPFLSFQPFRPSK